MVTSYTDSQVGDVQTNRTVKQELEKEGALHLISAI
jgi:hypothetical protein